MAKDRPAAEIPAFEKAIELHARGQLRDAAPLYETVLKTDPSHLGAARALGMLYLQSGLPDRATDRLAQALRIAPGNAAVHRDYAIALLALNLNEEAIASFDASIGIDAGDPPAHYFRANALLRVRRARDAVDGYDAAVALRPDYFEAIHNRANALRELGRLDEAIAGYETAAKLRPNLPVVLYNLAFALQDRGRFDESLENYNRAIGLKPDFHEARKARASLNLLQGRWDKGLPEFEHRLFASDSSLNARLRAVRYWSGESLENRSIAVYGDGAFGDMMQFGRYIPLLTDRGACVTVLLPSQFHKIFAGAFPGARIATDFDGGDAAGFRCEVMSLPFLLKATCEKVPPPLKLARDEERVALWFARMSEGKFKIGICWQGNPERNIDKGRSIPLAAFETLARVPGVSLVSLQKRHGLDQLTELPPGMAVETVGPGMDEGPDAFVDTAAIMASLDLVVTSDTAVAHLAATLGRPTWIALRDVPEWRWLLERQDSPWYRTVRLFRQKRPDQWGAVFDAIAAAVLKEI